MLCIAKDLLQLQVGHEAIHNQVCLQFFCHHTSFFNFVNTRSVYFFVPRHHRNILGHLPSSFNNLIGSSS